jgi:RNA polymerase sigma-70 factor, ECF subfamily
MMTLASAPRAAGPLAGPEPAGCDEAALIREAAAGDTRAFGELVRSHHRRVYNYLVQLTRHHHDAEDLTQQTFVKAFHHLARFDASRPLINWLLTIARNTALNHFRDTRRWEEMPVEPAGHEPSPARAAETKERTENLWARARAVLAPLEFEVLWLRFGEELSVRETAGVVGLTETHVKVLVFRARRALIEGKE